MLRVQCRCKCGEVYWCDALAVGETGCEVMENCPKCDGDDFEIIDSEYVYDDD